MYGEPSSYAYAGNPASSFLYDSMQNTYGGNSSQGLLQQQFGQVMNGMAGGIQTNAQMGILPGQGSGQMTPQQMAMQMNIGGPMSVLPYLGGAKVQKLLYPVAGLWSMVDGIKSMRALGNEARAGAYQKFDPSQLEYQKSLNEMHEVSARWAQLGPFDGYGDNSGVYSGF